MGNRGSGGFLVCFKKNNTTTEWPDSEPAVDMGKLNSDKLMPGPAKI